jgi:hypothetical protein
MLRPPICYSDNQPTSGKLAAAMATGSHGHAVNDLVYRPGPAAVFGRLYAGHVLDQAVADGHDYYYMDHAFMGRGKYYRAARNAVQYQPTDQSINQATPDRYERLRYDTAPEWQPRTGTSIVICPNSPTYMSWFGIDAHEWVLDLVDKIGRRSSRPIVVRWKASAKNRPLYVDLHTAHMVVTFSSMAAVEAIRAGVPVCTLAPWATTRSMGITDIAQVDDPVYPARRLPFLWDLADHQWSMDEIHAGLAWQTLERDAALYDPADRLQHAPAHVSG